MPPRARRYDAAHVAALLGESAPGEPIAPDHPLVRRLVVEVADADEPPDDAVRLAARAAADRLAAAAPGRSVEVRVTDPVLRFGVAVQCVEGPRHTRGTPPNVVEVTDAHAWVRLAAGRVGWADLTATGQLRASGERADLSAYLPVI